MLITPALIAELRYELSAFRYQVDMLQLRLDRFEGVFGKRKRLTKAKGIMCAKATGKRKLAFGLTKIAMRAFFWTIPDTFLGAIILTVLTYTF